MRKRLFFPHVKLPQSWGQKIELLKNDVIIQAHGLGWGNCVKVTFWRIR